MKEGRDVRLLWVAASGVGMALAGAAARPLSYFVGGAAHEALGGVPGEAVVGAVAGGGAFGGVGLAQWLALRRGRVPWAARWPAANALGGATAALAAFSTLEAGGGMALGVPLGILCYVAAFRIVLHPRHPQAWRVGMASAAAFLTAALLTIGAAALLGATGGGMAFAALLGALYGALLLPILPRGTTLSGRAGRPA